MREFEKAGCEMLTYEKLKPMVQDFDYDYFKAKVFAVKHNVPCWGIIIESKLTKEKLCYMTDFISAPKVEGIDYWLYEVNYIERFIDQMIDEDKDLKHLGFNNHNSLENAVEYFNTIKTRPKKIFCCHSSGSHSIKKVVKEDLEPFADEVVVL